MGEGGFGSPKKTMSLLDLNNLDKQLKQINLVKQSQEDFKHSKVKKQKYTKHTRKGYFENLNKQKSTIKFKRLINRIKKRRKLRNYKRCPKKYNVYINSSWWTKRKNKFYQSHPRICSACGSYKYITLHHMIYGKLGEELDEHLTPLCNPCHQEYHTLYGTKKNMLLTTKEFICKKYITQ
jgi:hypothetical protein